MEENIEKNENSSRKFWKGFLAGLSAALLVIVLVTIWKPWYTKDASGGLPESSSGETPKEIASQSTLQKIDIIQDTIDQFYLEKPDYALLQEGIYEGVLDALGDPYSTYYSKEKLVDIQNQTQGIYYGIGAYIGLDARTEMPVLSKIIEKTPAEESGLLAGDVIIKVDDTETQGMELTDVVSKVKGEEGTKVSLTIFREGDSDYRVVDVERRKIESPTVAYKMMEDQIAYIEIREFDEITIDQFREAYVVAQGNDMKGLVLDLRSNPGGNLSAVVEIARMLLPKGMIVYTEDKYGERMEYTCDGTQQIQVPMTVLINGNSASASEILAGAIKDYGIGTLVGTTTYGKGIVQRIINLSDGSAVKLTVSKYYTPKGNNIHKIGIEPDVELELDAEAYIKDGTDNQLQKAVEIVKGK